MISNKIFQIRDIVEHEVPRLRAFVRIVQRIIEVSFLRIRHQKNKSQQICSFTERFSFR